MFADLFVCLPGIHCVSHRRSLNAQLRGPPTSFGGGQGTGISSRFLHTCIITFYIWFCGEWTNKDNNEWTIDKISFFKENVKTNMYHTNYCLNLAMGMNYVHLWVLTVVQIFFWATRTCNFWAEEARDKGVKTEAISGEFIGIEFTFVNIVVIINQFQFGFFQWNFSTNPHFPQPLETILNHP